MKITVSLLNAYMWYKNCPPSWKARAIESLKNTLTKEFTGTVATERGDKFEQVVNKQLVSVRPFTGIMKPLNALKGMAQQKWLEPYTVSIGDGFDFTFRGKMDYYGKTVKPVLAGWGESPIIADLKTTSSESIKGERYIDSVQHVVYMLAMRTYKFLYFVCRFDDETSLTPVEIQPISASIEEEDASDVHYELASKIEGLVKFLKDFHLWNDYFEIFNGGKK